MDITGFPAVSGTYSILERGTDHRSGKIGKSKGNRCIIYSKYSQNVGKGKARRNGIHLYQEYKNT